MEDFTQTCGIDYLKTFTPITKMNTIRLISFAANYDWELQQLDVKNAYMEELEEEI